MPGSRKKSGGAPAVLVIGDVMLDIIAAPQGAIEFATDTPATITLLPGGSGANQAAWLGHFGNAVRFVGRVGHASYAEHAAALRAHGVEPIFATDATIRTGTLVTLIGPGGERSFLTDRGANAHLERGDLADALLDDVDHVHISGYAFFSAGPRAAISDFLAVAAGRGVPYSVDCGSRAFLREVGPAAFLAWTHGAAICFANATEAALFEIASDRSGQRSHLGVHFETLIVTNGASGADATTAFGTQSASIGAPIVEAVDTTGAGDAFLAGFLTAHLRGEPLELSVACGVAAGSRAVVRYGGRPPLPGL